MNFLDDSLFPENQEKLVITAAPYGPEWEPADFPEDIPLTMDQHVQQAVDCWEAGATVLHIHVRELDGKGSKRCRSSTSCSRRLREAVPEMILQVGGSISFAPEGEGADAKWLSDDTRHMLAELDPKPDQVTIAINTSQMNIVELMTDSDIAGTSFQRPELYEAYRNMEVPASPAWVEEHLRRLTANGIQPHFQLAHSAQLETVERLVRRGVYTGPLNITWVAIGGGFDGPNPYTMMEFIRRVPDGASLTLESIMRNVLPINTMAIAMGLHTRCGNEDTLWAQARREDARRPPPSEQLVRIAERAGPRGRHGQGSPRDLPARRVLGQRRRGAGQARLRAQPQARPAGLPAPRLIGALPAPRRSAVRARFPRARTRTAMSTANREFEVDPTGPVTDGTRTRARTRMERRHGIAGHREPDRRHRRRRRRPTPTPAARVFPWIVFVLTFGLLLSDYMSRQVLSAVFPFLKAEWALTDTQLGALTSVVALTVGLLAVPLSLLGDRWGRSRAIVLMAARLEPGHRRARPSRPATAS